MTWAKLDDRANEHRKILAAGAEACWLWSCGLMYANRQRERDGFIPEPMIAMLYPFKAPKKLADKLVEVKLWDRVAGGYQIHEFTWWNQSREQREAELEAGRQRAAKSYAAKQAKNADSSPEEEPKTSGVFESSSPILPDPTPTPLPTPTPTPEEPTVLHSAAAVRPVDFTDSDRMTTCPLDLAERAEKMGVFGDIAGKLKVPIESLRAEANRYVTHFVVGAGMGEEGNRWMKRLRGQLTKKAQAGELTPPGALEHARRGRHVPAEAPVFDALAVGRRINADREAENNRRREAANALRQANDGK